MKKIKVATVCFLLLLSACSDTKPKVEGLRLSVSEMDHLLTPQITAEKMVSFRLDNARKNQSWEQQGGNASKNISLPYLSEFPKLKRTQSIGEGENIGNFLLSSPVISDGMIFTTDTELLVKATDEETGKTIWETSLNEDQYAVKGIGLAVRNGTLFVATGLKKIVALSVKDGKQKWETTLESPARSAPTVADGKIFLTTLTNQLIVLNEKDGKILWTKEESPVQTLFLKTASPAVAQHIAIVPYASGEVVAYQTTTGNEIWRSHLVSGRVFNSRQNMTHITASPVIKGNDVYLFGNANSLVKADLKTGKIKWKATIGGTNQFALQKGILFLITNTNQAVAVDGENGKILWVYQLPSFTDEDSRKKSLTWEGPLPVSERLIIVGSDGRILTLSPAKGTPLGWEELSSGTHLPPVIADGKLVFLTKKGVLEIYE